MLIHLQIFIECLIGNAVGFKDTVGSVPLKAYILLRIE